MKTYSKLYLLIVFQIFISLDLNAQELLKVEPFKVSPVLGNVFGAGSPLDSIIVVRTGDPDGFVFKNIRYEAYLITEKGQALKIDSYFPTSTEGLISVAGKIASNETFIVYQVGNKVASYNKTLKQAVTLATPGDDSLINDISLVNDRFIYTIEKGDGFIELWATQGKLENSVLIKKLAVPRGAGFLYGGFTESAIIEDTVLFSAAEASVGEELFSTNGIAGSFEVVKDIIPGFEPAPFNTAFSSSPMDFVNDKTHVYFVATDAGFTSQSIWVSDATSSGTNRLISSTSIGIRLIGTIDDGLVFWEPNNTGSGNVMFLEKNSINPRKLGESGFPQHNGESFGELMFMEESEVGSTVTATVHRVHGDPVILSMNTDSFSRTRNPDRNFISKVLSTEQGGVYFDINSCEQSVCESEIFRWKGENVEKVFERIETQLLVRFDEAFISQDSLFMPVELGSFVTTLNLYSSMEFSSMFLPLQHLILLLDE